MEKSMRNMAIRHLGAAPLPLRKGHAAPYLDTTCWFMEREDDLMKRAVFGSIFALVMTIPAASVIGARQQAGPDAPRIRSLVLVPARIDPAAGVALLPRPEERTDGDGAAFYAKAAQALPRTLNEQQIRDWLKAPLTELPQAQVQKTLQQARASLDHVTRGTQCKSCTWPPFKPQTMPAHLNEYRTLTQVLALQARLQMTQGQFDAAIATIRTNLAMAKHIGESPVTVQGMVGVAMAAMALQGIEDLAQARNSPNLYGALKALPRPLVDLEVPMSSELNSLESNKQFNVLTRAAMRRHLRSSFDRVRQLMHRLDANVSSLQTIEALRHYAATHDGRFPAQLADITDTEIPDNPATQEPFVYRRRGMQAILEISAPKGGRPRDAVRYEITMAR
jgi:hypothetical protein